MVFAVFCSVNVGESIGIGFCSLLQNVGLSVSMTNAILGIFVVMSGLMSASMPIFLDRLNLLSPIPYVTRLMTINEFDPSVTFTCTENETSKGMCLYRNGTDVLTMLSGPGLEPFDYQKIAYYAGLTATLVIIYRLIAGILLKVKAG